MFIGKSLKELRKSRQMTLVELSEKSGVQVATLSRIENNKMTGTLESHMQIAKALGVDVTKLYSDIIREETRVEISSTTPSDIFVHSDKSSYEILTTKVLSKQMMPILLSIEPGGQSALEENKLGTEKFAYVLEGEVQIIIGEKNYLLSKGGSLYFDATLKHQFINKSSSKTKILAIITPPTL